MDWLKSDRMLGRCLSWVLDQMLLSALTLVCSLPLVTAGPALCALYGIERQIAAGDEPLILTDFFREMKKEFRFGLTVTLALWGCAGVVVSAFAFCVKKSIALPWTAAFLGAGLLCLYAVGCWVYPLGAQFREKPRKTLKNGALLAFCHLPQTLLMLAVGILPLGLFLVMPQFLLLLWTGFLIFFCPGVVAWLCTKIAGSVLRRYLPEEAEDGAGQ